MPNPWAREDSPNPISDVNVVPLADVSLVLLILLLVLSPMAAQSMLHVHSAGASSAPAEAALPPPDPEPVLAVGLSRSGYVVEGFVLKNDAELHAWLMLELARRADKKVFLSPELDVDNGHIVSTIELIQSCGASAALVQVEDPDAGRR